MLFQTALELTKTAPTHKSLANRIFKSESEKVAEARELFRRNLIGFLPKIAYNIPDAWIVYTMVRFL